MLEWNYSYVIPSFLILIILMGYYFALPRLPLLINRTFLAILINEFIVISLDIISSYTDNRFKEFPYGMNIFLNTAFFVAFTVRIYTVFRFTSLLFKRDQRPWKSRPLLISFIICQAVIILGSLSGLIFHIDVETGYHKGPMYFVIYIPYFSYILYSMYMLYSCQGRIRRKRERISVFAYNLVIAVGLFFRISFPSYLLFDTFCIISILIIYLSFENPEFYLESRNVAFNSKGLRSYLEENEKNGKFKMFSFVIRDYHDIREIYGTAQMNHGISLISMYLTQTYPNCLCFYYQRGRFVLLGKEDLDWEDIHENVRTRFKSPWRADNAELYLGVAFAMIDCSNGYNSADVVLNTIGIMLENANRLGDDYNVLSDDSAILEYEERVEVKRALENAVDNNTVEVFLQPLIDAKTRKLSGAEALARIRSEKGEIIPPSVFIPVAEQNGRINALGEQVFEKVCKFIHENDMPGMGISFINVNLSPIQFMRKDLTERFSSITQKYEVPPEIIHLEITEEAMIDEYLMDKQVRNMRKCGFQFVLDDYGKGYSNITRLKKTSFINVKIDMEVVWDHCASPDELLPMAVKTFKNKGYGITAEGIETEKMAEIMQNIGCDFLQGMYFSAPIPLDEFVKRYYE